MPTTSRRRYYVVVNAEKGIVACEAPTNPRSFFEEAVWQKACAVCGSTGPFEAHHVIKRQKVRRFSTNEYDPRNCLRLCEGLETNQCHHGHRQGNVTIETGMLTDDNICYGWDLLGEAFENELDRYYTGADERYLLHPKHECPRCQIPPEYVRQCRREERQTTR